jgi:hypothetical protein
MSPDGPPQQFPPPGPFGQGGYSGGYPQAPGEPPAPFGPPPPYAQRPVADGKAVASLMFGVFSLLGCGLFFSAPAVILGVLARRDIHRSGGTVGGGGLAIGGIVTGSVGALTTLVWVAVLGVGLLTSDTKHASIFASPSSPAIVAPVTPAAPAPEASGGEALPSEGTAAPSPTVVTVNTSIDVVALVPSPSRLRDQLREELRTAAARGETLLVQTSAAWAPVCTEIDVSLGDRRMENALAKVRLVRVDVDGFENDLKAMRMYEGSVPWFYLLDAKTARPLDAIGADEWDDNVPENMAPVLGKFVKGTYTARRHGSPLGGTSL